MTTIKGLLLAGGASSRMGQPKALLPYQGEVQLFRAARLLQPFCTSLYLSCQATQTAVYRQAGWEAAILEDQPRYGAIGPMNGVLTAFDAHPGPWLVLGCDYPLLQEQDLQLLLTSRKENQLAVAFDTATGLEPLLTLYEASSEHPLRSFWEKGQQSLRYFLSSHPIQRVPPPQPGRLQSIDTPEHYHSVHLT